MNHSYLRLVVYELFQTPSRVRCNNFRQSQYFTVYGNRHQNVSSSNCVFNYTSSHSALNSNCLWPVFAKSLDAWVSRVKYTTNRNHTPWSMKKADSFTIWKEYDVTNIWLKRLCINSFLYIENNTFWKIAAAVIAEGSIPFHQRSQQDRITFLASFISRSSGANTTANIYFDGCSFLPE